MFRLSGESSLQPEFGGGMVGTEGSEAAGGGARRGWQARDFILRDRIIHRIHRRGTLEPASPPTVRCLFRVQCRRGELCALRV